MVRLELRSGSIEARVIVRPARDWSAMLKTVRSAVALPFAADKAKVKRSRVRVIFIWGTR